MVKKDNSIFMATPSQTTVLITDLDNTLYDFAGMFSPSFRAMVHALSKETGISESTFVAEFKEIFDRHNTLEYTFSVQELPCLQNKSPADLQQLVHVANVAFGRTRRKRLRLYPNVKETLLWAANGGVKLCVATNAPLYHVYRRLLDLGILGLFSVISSRDGLEVPAHLGDHIRKYKTAVSTLYSRMGQVTTHPVTELKPRIDMLRSIQNHWRNIDAVFYSIGDSVNNDLYPSSTLGMVTIWARYGMVIEPKNLTTMLEMTPSITLTKVVDQKNFIYVPDHTIDNFVEIKEMLPVMKQLSLI